MLHPLITHLRSQFPLAEWLFILTAYELAKTDWIERGKVITAAALPQHSTNVSTLTSKLKQSGYIETKTAHNGVNNGSMHIRLTPASKAMLKAAFNLAAAAAGTAKAQNATHVLASLT